MYVRLCVADGVVRALLIFLNLRKGVLPWTVHASTHFVPHTTQISLPLLKFPYRKEIDKMFTAISTGAIPYNGSGAFVSSHRFITRRYLQIPATRYY